MQRAYGDLQSTAVPGARQSDSESMQTAVHVRGGLGLGLLVQSNDYHSGVAKLKCGWFTKQPLTWGVMPAATVVCNLATLRGCRPPVIGVLPLVWYPSKQRKQRKNTTTDPVHRTHGTVANSAHTQPTESPAIDINIQTATLTPPQTHPNRT